MKRIFKRVGKLYQKDIDYVAGRSEINRQIGSLRAMLCPIGRNMKYFTEPGDKL